MARLLVVDSSTAECASISGYLRAAGHEAICATDSAAAMTLLRDTHFDAVITEWHLVDGSALELAARIRQNPHGSCSRILVAGKQIKAEDIASALGSGIDDCLAKSAPPEELVARVNAVLRRPAIPWGALLEVDPVALDVVSHKVTVRGREVELAPAEFRLLAYLMENRGRVLTRKELLAKVWQQRKGIGERTVDVHVRRLRAVMERHGCETLLQTVRGFGYRFG